MSKTSGVFQENSGYGLESRTHHLGMSVGQGKKGQGNRARRLKLRVLSFSTTTSGPTLRGWGEEKWKTVKEV
jgi:hypothetical protein